MLVWLMVRRGAYWIVIRVCLLSSRCECWTQSYAGGEGSERVGSWRGDSAANSGRWMEGIRGLTDMANGNKWLPCQLTNERTGLGIEPITADKHWHDAVCVFSSNVTHFCSSSAEIPKTRSFMHYAVAFWRGHDCIYSLHAWVWDVCESVCACSCLCNVHSCIAVMDGPVCCSTGGH